MLCMNTECEKCLHQNVCKKREAVKELCGNLEVSYDLQKLKNLGISVDLSCVDYTTEAMHVYTKVIKKEED